MICFTVGVFICVFTFNSRLCFPWDKNATLIRQQKQKETEQKQRQQIYLLKCKVFVEHVWRALFFFFFYIGWRLNVLVRGFLVDFCGCICLLIYYNNFIWCCFFFIYSLLLSILEFDRSFHFTYNKFYWLKLLLLLLMMTDSSVFIYIIIIILFQFWTLSKSSLQCVYIGKIEKFISMCSTESECVVSVVSFNYLNVSLFLIRRICSAIGTLVDYI